MYLCCWVANLDNGNCGDLLLHEGNNRLGTFDQVVFFISKICWIISSEQERRISFHRVYYHSVNVAVFPELLKLVRLGILYWNNPTPLKKYLLRNVHKTSSYHTGNTLRLHYKYQLISALQGNKQLFTVRTIRNTLHGQNAGIQYFKVPGTYRTTGLKRVN
jgi:hypothetical protein